MNYNNLSIGKKLALAFSVVGFAIIGLGLFLVSELEHISDSFLEFADLTVPSVLLVDKIELESTKIRGDQYANITLIGAPLSEMKEWMDDDDRLTAAVTQLLADYRISLFSDEERQVFKHVENAWDNLLQAQAPVHALMMQSKGKEASRMIADSFDEFTAFHGSLDKLAQVNKNFIRDDRAMTLKKVSSATMLTYAGIGIIIIFMFFMNIFLAKKIRNPLIEVMKAAKQIALGNLAYEINREHIGDDELGQLADSCTEMRANLSGLIEDIGSAVIQLSAAIEEVSAISAQSSQGMGQQQDEITLVATAMHQLQMTVNEVARNTEDASTAAATATHDAELGSKDIQRSIVSIQQVSEVIEDAGEMVNKLEENSTSIGMIVDVIRSIADQTNLLALNAAIEAARAGEQGRGFAVVADEVRTLAGRTQSSTNEIVEIIEKLQLQAKKAGEATKQSCDMIQSCVVESQKTGEKINMIEDAVTQIASMNTQIASACSEQTSVTEDLNRNVTNINLSSTEVATGSQQTAQACVELSQLSSELKTTMMKFKLV
ncbi:MAG: methyl-accepting chemotaxis protein [Moritella dasanensis]|jgi:methyl-accepting chemotaxis protein